MIKYTSWCYHCIHFKDNYYFSPTCAECFWVTASSPPEAKSDIVLDSIFTKILKDEVDWRIVNKITDNGYGYINRFFPNTGEIITQRLDFDNNYASNYLYYTQGLIYDTMEAAKKNLEHDKMFWENIMNQAAIKEHTRLCKRYQESEEE